MLGGVSYSGKPNDKLMKSSFRIAPLSNGMIDASQISYKTIHELASTLWLSHKNRPPPNLGLLVNTFNMLKFHIIKELKDRMDG